ncbi:FAD-dependent oxidoreductase [Nocardioides cavernaquae]|uniref:FAD-dependent oxidoreductase n=1 Tax=Nocardioides cavernaquae TaxID=2321396 RepID=A0A3A5HCA9_9ACTN|nr:FAD-dependent oxidoreductase [Nocardioides cavernaquae]
MRILGAGIVGLACAHELIERGHTVEVVDPNPGSGASYAAAGMLSPAGELWHGEADLFRLGSESASLWPAYAAALGVPTQETGTVLAGADAGDLQEIDRQLALLAEAGVRANELTRRELLTLEPGLGRISGGGFLPDDHSVDPRAVVAALLARVRTRPEPSTDPVDLTILATGAQLPEPFADLVRPVRGEVLRLRVTEVDLPRHTVRGFVRGEPVYVVPRANGEVVVGATSEEHDVAPVPTVEGVFRLLEAARELIPALDRAEFVEATARDRPGTPDNLPLIGLSGVDGVLLAAGHYRHGVLLAPITAQLIADAVEGVTTDAAVDPQRFLASQPQRSPA